MTKGCIALIDECANKIEVENCYYEKWECFERFSIGNTLARCGDGY